MVNPSITAKPHIGYTDCSLDTKIIGNLIFYMPAILLILIAIMLIRRGRKRKQKVYLIFAGFLLIAAFGYRVYLSLQGFPLIFPFGCI